MSVKPTLLPPSPTTTPRPLQPTVLNGQYQAWENTSQSQLKNACPFYIAFQVLKILLVKTWFFFLFLVVFISFYISRHHFSKVFGPSFSIIPSPPRHLNGQNPLSLTKIFCWCFLTTSPQPLLKQFASFYCTDGGLI